MTRPVPGVAASRNDENDEVRPRVAVAVHQLSFAAGLLDDEASFVVERVTDAVDDVVGGDAACVAVDALFGEDGFDVVEEARRVHPGRRGQRRSSPR